MVFESWYQAQTEYGGLSHRVSRLVGEALKPLMEIAFRAGQEYEREQCAMLSESGARVEAMDGEEGSAAMVRVLDRQADLIAQEIRERSGNVT